MVNLLVESSRLFAGRSIVTLLRSRRLFVATMIIESGTHTEMKFMNAWVTTTLMDLGPYRPGPDQVFNVIVVTVR